MNRVIENAHNNINSTVLIFLFLHRSHRYAIPRSTDTRENYVLPTVFRVWKSEMEHMDIPNKLDLAGDCRYEQDQWQFSCHCFIKITDVDYEVLLHIFQVR